MINPDKISLRDFCPPVAWKLLGYLPRPASSPAPLGDEQPSEYYNQFGRDSHLGLHYTRSQYYPTWLLIVDRLQAWGCSSVLDIGCGPGQFARLLHDNRISSYVGVDFNQLRIQHAERICPSYSFICRDISEDGLIEAQNYDAVVLTEFLEHVTGDLEVIQRIQPGASILATVPNHGGKAHVRKFESTEDVIVRYGTFIDNVKVRTVPLNESGSSSLQFFEGTRNSTRLT